MITIKTVTNYERLTTKEKRSFTRIVNLLTDKGNRVIKKEGNLIILSSKVSMDNNN
jgi:hypothetical protein